MLFYLLMFLSPPLELLDSYRGVSILCVCLSVVCSLIDNDIRHHSGQNVVDSRGAADNAEPLSICFYHNIQRQRKSLF